MKGITLIKGDFYNTLTSKRQDSDALKLCMEETIQKLLDSETDMHKPGMLLGNIQGGKTRAFIGIIALAFDNEYDMAIILTKGTKALARQTYARLKEDYREFIDDDMIRLYDILHIPEGLSGWVLKRKIVMIVKKETNNLERTIRAIVSTYSDLSNRKVLIIDDEADFASIGFTRNRKEGIIELNRIASQIDELRKKVEKSDFLQVTATPYSLYLQPDESNISVKTQQFIFEPIRPAFTVLLPIYEGYIGGDFYFKKSKEENTIAYYVYEEIFEEELIALKKEDRRIFKLEEALSHNKIEIIRIGIMNFIVGACIRWLQQRKAKERIQKYCFVVHTERGKQSHEWQIQIVDKLKDLFIYSAHNNKPLLAELVRKSYEDLSASIRIVDKMPPFKEVFEEVVTALKDDCVMIRKVNSETEVEQLLDDNGELERTAPLNIFIGGQILDRGVTIRNLIGFYYGRRPGRFQQDTVLQHSRMFGYRTKEDLTVTRFYTALAIYSIMGRINEFDNALREGFEKGAQKGVVFIHKDTSNKLIPCSPHKILISSTVTITPNKRMLPIGFQTDYKSKIRSTLDKLDDFILSKIPARDKNKPFIIDLDTAHLIIDMIDSMFVYEPNWEWDVESFKASLEFLSKNSNNPKTKGKVWCIVRTGRKISRFRKDGITFSDAPDTPQDELGVAYQIAIDEPALILLRQEGLKEQDWMDSPFWWPVMVAPKKMQPVIFASEYIEVE
ncbi:MAG: hypothetical protein JXA17_08335 [Dehalococcoidales bacterium]|nr:hypothetical protein [Dehalococcoidales bacterium]